MVPKMQSGILRNQSVGQHEADGRSLVSRCGIRSGHLRNATLVDEIPCACIRLDGEREQAG